MVLGPAGGACFVRSGPHAAASGCRVSPVWRRHRRGQGRGTPLPRAASVGLIADSRPPRARLATQGPSAVGKGPEPDDSDPKSSLSTKATAFSLGNEYFAL